MIGFHETVVTKASEAFVTLMKTFITIIALTLSTACLAQPYKSFKDQPYKPSDSKRYIPEGAYALKPVFNDAIATTWPTLQYPGYIYALAEKESCISLTHKRCFKTNSKLDSARELGVGIGQITIAYRLRPGGNSVSDRVGVRFDALDENRHLDPRLKDLNWGNITSRADLQIILMVSMAKKAFNTFSSIGATHMETLRFADAAYNGGIGGTRQRILKCAATPNCNKGVWFGHVETKCVASRKPIYGTRSACDINEEHVHSTTVHRLDKYMIFYKN